MSTLRQLTYFVAVADDLSFTRAAERMFVAQPSLSQQILALERELDVALLERLPRAVRLTPEGRLVLAHAREAVQSAERAVSEARAALNLEGGELRISTVRSIAAGLLPGVIRRWHDQHPGVHVHLQEHAHRQLVEDSLREATIDLAVGPAPSRWTGGMADLGFEEFLLVLPPDDPLASRSSIRLRMLARRRWVTFESGHGLNDVMGTACTTLGEFQPMRAVETSQVETAARLAAAGMGPTLLPASTIPVGLEAAVVPVDPPVGRYLAAYTRGDWSPMAEAFVTLLQDAHAGQAPDDAVVVP